MELKDQVCSLEQANMLHQLGVKKSGEFYFRNPERPDSLKHVTQGLYGIPAYTASELGEMLPCESGIICWDVSYSDHRGEWNCRIYDLVKWLEQEQKEPIPPVAYESEGDTMAECMADALIHCLENKLVTP